MTDTTKPREYPAMTDIKDNPPPLPTTRNPFFHFRVFDVQQYCDGRDAAFERGKAAMQGEIDHITLSQEMLETQYQVLYELSGRQMDTIDDLRAKLKAMEEQKPVAWATTDLEEIMPESLRLEHVKVNSFTPRDFPIKLYTAAGAKT